MYKKEQFEGNLLFKMSKVSYEKMDFDELSQSVNFKCINIFEIPLKKLMRTLILNFQAFYRTKMANRQ